MEPASGKSATGTTASAVTLSTSEITSPTTGGGRMVLATPLQTMINNAIAASMTAMSSSTERMMQEAVSKATVPGPGAGPSSTPGAGGGLLIPSDKGITSAPTGIHPALPCVGALPGGAVQPREILALSGYHFYPPAQSRWPHHLSLWPHLLAKYPNQKPFWLEQPHHQCRQRLPDNLGP